MAWRPFRFFRWSRDLSREDNAIAIYNRGTRFSSHGHHEEALEWYERALSLDPAHAESHYGRGAAFAALGRHEEAIRTFEDALALRPNFLSALYGCGVSFAAMNQHAEAIACYDRVLAQEPQHVDALYGRGLCSLAAGDLPRGFADLFAGRDYREGMKAWERWIVKLSSPWRGEAPLAGKTILLYSDGGLGDTIQFSRYAPLVAERGARVVLRVPRKVRGLIGVLPLVDRVIAEGERLPKHDFHCSLLRLPLVLRTTLDTIPAVRRYLRADTAPVASWAKRLGPRRKPRVGIAWAGSKFNHPYNARRTIPLNVLQPLADLDCELISLQRPIPREDRAALRAMPRLKRLGESLTDFAEISALIENLDLVISVDSAMAHLAGSLGKPVWVLLSYTPDWRWFIGRTDSPWYPSARLFRQTVPGDWRGVVANVQTAWGQFVSELSLGGNDHVDRPLTINRIECRTPDA
jgi:tetratricopeptide (TPR) repeat protein